MKTHKRISVVEVPQVGGRVRMLAFEGKAPQLSEMDGVAVEACLDIDPDGSRSWELPFGCKDSRAGRAAIKKYLDD